MKDKKKLLGWAVAAVIAFLAGAFLAGCSNTKEIERVYIHDTISRTNVVYDSVDRWRTHYQYIKGDSVFIVDTIYKSKVQKTHDTIVDVRHDVQLKEVEKVVEKRVNMWWTGVLAFFALLGIAVALGAAVGRLFTYMDKKDEEDIE